MNQTTIMPEDNSKQKQQTSLIHKNIGVQSVIEKARKEAHKKIQLLASKKEQLKKYENQFYKEMSYFSHNPQPDIDQTTRMYHLVEGYTKTQDQSKQKTTQKDYDET